MNGGFAHNPRCSSRQDTLTLKGEQHIPGLKQHTGNQEMPRDPHFKRGPLRLFLPLVL
jgi:hypothetical protein